LYASSASDDAKRVEKSAVLARLRADYATMKAYDLLVQAESGLAMITGRSARLLRLPDYGIEVGKAADLVVLDCARPEQAIAELASPMTGFKRGRRTFTRAPVELHRPAAA